MHNPDTLPDDDGALLRMVGTAVYGQQWVRPMSRDVGVSHSLLWSIERGERRLTEALRLRLARWAASAEVDTRAEARERIALLAAVVVAWGGADIEAA